MITHSSLPLKALETSFAVDSTGFGSSRFVRWHSARWGRQIEGHDWVKVHLMCGTLPNIVTSVEVTSRNAKDAPFFTPLVDRTAEHFNLEEVSADKAYSSHKNLATVVRHGGTPYIAFKGNAKPGEENSLWAKMFHFYSYKQAEFEAHYHKRSNVESTFGAIKAKFGDSVKSQNPIAQTNEVLLKVLCHNLCVLNHSINEFGLDLLDFHGESK